MEVVDHEHLEEFTLPGIAHRTLSEELELVAGRRLRTAVSAPGADTAVEGLGTAPISC